MLFMKEHVTKQAKRAKEASRQLALVPVEVRNAALLAMADALEARQEEILEVNAKEVAAAKEKGTRLNMIDRLILTAKRISGMAEGIRQVVKLDDPIGKLDFEVVRPNGLKIRRVRVPFGVVGIIYEARPNVTADAIALCIKSGNACLLRGGSEAVRTNKKIVDIMREAAVAHGLPEKSIEFISIIDRDAIVVMCRLRKIVDVIIPRGGAGLIARVVEHSTVPVIETGTGVCHTFVDKTADFDMAIKICVNAKTQRPSVCNAMETLLIHKDIAEDFLPKVAAALENVELRGDEACLKILPDMKAATDDDWTTEYNDLRLIISTNTAANIPTRLSRATRTTPRSLNSKSIRLVFMSMPRRASLTVSSSVSARRSVSARKNFTRADQWGLRLSPRPNISLTAKGKFAADV